MGFMGFKFGRYPDGYNPKVHGPYYPHRYYGPADTNIWDVKLGDLSSWIARREKSPGAIVNAISRWYCRVQYKWQSPISASFMPIYQMVFFASTLSFVLYYNKNKYHYFHKYH